MIKVRNEEGEYPCYICPEVLNSKRDLRQHTISIHKDDKSRVCPTCDIGFKDISSVRRHVKTVHIKEKQFVCSLCEKQYMHKYDLENHFQKKHSPRNLNTNDRKVCPDCQSTFLSTAGLTEHMQRLHKKTINYIKCPFCIKIFFDPIYLKQHVKRVHGSDSSSLYICKFCPVVSDVLETFTTHMAESHSWIATLICTRKGCNEYFQTEEELVNHLETHPKQTWTRKKSEARALKCWECETQCETRDMVVAHFSDVHSCYPRFECKTCSTFFRNRDDLSIHIPCSKYKYAYTDFVELTIHENPDSSSSSYTEESHQFSKKRKITPLPIGSAVEFRNPHSIF